MGIDMTKYKMIYKNRVYNCLSVIPIESIIDNKVTAILDLKVTYIDENNRISLIEDKVEEFQFVLK